MPILAFYDNNQDHFDDMNIEQIIAICGDGKLKDNSKSLDEFRTYLKRIDSETLYKYANHCLENSFKDSGYVLQDLVNEIGRRLDFNVTNGLYQGRQGSIGYDGIWERSDGFNIVIEVKTTDAYRINLDTIQKYRKNLARQNIINYEFSSILIVVGRSDTGDLEAQVRGSKNGWDTRIISIDSLIKLLRLKETTEEATTEKIGELLCPFENTRLDKFIDIAFTAAMDASEQDDDNIASLTENNYKQIKTPKEVIENKRKQIIELSIKEFKTPLIRKTAALYWNPEEKEKQRIACTISKKYDKNGYWYGFHKKWRAFLTSSKQGYLALGCIDLQTSYLLPINFIEKHIEKFNHTDRDDKIYWHIHIEGDESEMEILLNSGERISINNYRYKL